MTSTASYTQGPAMTTAQQQAPVVYYLSRFRLGVGGMRAPGGVGLVEQLHSAGGCEGGGVSGG